MLKKEDQHLSHAPESRYQRYSKSCQVIASYKSNFLRKADFVLKSGYQVTAFFMPFELDTLFCHKFCLQMNTTIISGASENDV